MFLFSVLCIVSCNKCSKGKAKPVVLVAVPEKVNEEVSKLIELQLSDFDTLKLLVVADDSLFSTKQILNYYKNNNFNPIWTNMGNHIKQSDSLLDIIKNADKYGLISSDYHFDQIQKIVSMEKDSLTKKYDAVKISEIDILMTDAFFTLIVHIYKGRLNAQGNCRRWKGDGIDRPLTAAYEELVNG